MANAIRAEISRLRRLRRGQTEPDLLTEEPAEDLSDPRTRRIRVCDPPQRVAQTRLSLAEVREVIAEAIATYLATANPTHMLLVKAPPGAGKTTAAVRAAEMEAAKGHRRVLYAAPRHDLVGDIVALAQHPEWWYEWQPRRRGDRETGVGETCRYAEQIGTWLHRGYPAMAFCAGVCGWDYVNRFCAYHEQRKRMEPIIVGQHPHVWGGHPFNFHVLIGDECPIATFGHEWVVPERHIAPPGLEVTDPLTELVHELADLAARDLRLEGPALLAALGGAARVVSTCEHASIPLDASALTPSIHTPDEAEDAPYFHLPALVHLLLREGRTALTGADYPPRVIVSDHKLLLLLRRQVSEQMPRHVVWLDGTGEERLYREVFGRPVEVVEPEVRLAGRVFQVHDSANGKGAVARKNAGTAARETTAKRQHLRQQAEVIASRYARGRVAIVAHLALKEHFADWPGEWAHFYAARGTNRLEDCDALIVIGTPQPALHELEKLARMIFWKRMRPFRVGAFLPWSVNWTKYVYVDTEGRGREIPVGDLADEDLSALLRQLREAEIVQAAHRARPNLRPVDIWLLTNLPIGSLPPTELLSVHDLFQAPSGVDAYRWPAVKTVAEAKRQAGEPLYSADLAQHAGVSQDSAVRYLEVLVSTGDWQWPEPHIVPKRGRGPGAKAIVPRTECELC